MSKPAEAHKQMIQGQAPKVLVLDDNSIPAHQGKVAKVSGGDSENFVSWFRSGSRRLDLSTPPLEECDRFISDEQNTAFLDEVRGQVQDPSLLRRFQYFVGNGLHIGVSQDKVLAWALVRMPELVRYLEATPSGRGTLIDLEPPCEDEYEIVIVSYHFLASNHRMKRSFPEQFDRSKKGGPRPLIFTLSLFTGISLGALSRTDPTTPHPTAALYDQCIPLQP